MTEKKESLTKPEGGIAIIPKTKDRPIAIVGMGSTGKEIEQVKQLSERLSQVGMEHVLLSMEDAKKEGITREDLVSAQLEQAQAEGLLGNNPLFNDSGNGTRVRNGGGSKVQQKFKRKKKGKKTHRKKRK